MGAGSSPLARGKLFSPDESSVPCRIIPACAGETYTCDVTWYDGEDHPRLRGGNALSSATVGAAMGSSPLARGKPRVEDSEGDRPRIIPACAGETNMFEMFAAASRDHPRLRGGNP